MFKKILIANRGEIACRIARTCRRLGVAVAGVHSSADRDALHVRQIGESVEIGGAPASESYLRIDAVIAAAKSVGAEAIHPGFGFLAENAAFARAVEAAGLVFIGPTADVIERLGDKAAAKREAKAAKVPIVPGSEAPSVDPAAIAASVRAVGLPVMLKAAAGGGGKGMRGITSLEGLEQEIESAMREAKNSFGDAGLIVEKLIRHGRHIEIQIAGDGQGRVIHLFERECTLQRRHQKVIEEAPAANLSAKMRDSMAADAVRLGERLKYRGVGTVEFIVGADEYHFLEVNPRLQVEHPVTEMVTGLDIVEIHAAHRQRRRPARAAGRCAHPRPCRRGAHLRRGPGGRLPAVHRQAVAGALPRPRRARRDRHRKRHGGHALLRLDAGQADHACADARRSTGPADIGARGDGDLRRHHQPQFPAPPDRLARDPRRHLPQRG